MAWSTVASRYLCIQEGVSGGGQRPAAPSSATSTLFQSSVSSIVTFPSSMASAHLLHHHYFGRSPSSGGRRSHGSFKNWAASPDGMHAPSRFRPNTLFHRYPPRGIKASSPSGGDGRKLEIVYDPEDRINRIADEVDRNTGLSRLSLFSPCKVNVFLRITSKREDGFHDLASLFHVISLGDTIKFSLSPAKTRDRLSANVSGIPLDDRNLIIKALKLYRKKTGSDKFFWIHVDKKVPTGAGLGGGSSNAATALWAANQFNGCIATEKELQEWSGELGSDVPFFFSHGAAYCMGRGEIVQDIPPPIPLDLPMTLIKPQEACPTGEVYKRLCMDQTSSADPLSLLSRITQNGISQDLCINDLEPPAFEVVPALKRLKQRVLAASRGEYNAVFMSGSGSTVVGIGSPDPPQFVYDDEDLKNVFLSEAYFLTREKNQWYCEPHSLPSSFSNDSMMNSSIQE